MFRHIKDIKRLAADEVTTRREAPETYLEPLDVKGSSPEDARKVSDFLWEFKKTYKNIPTLAWLKEYETVKYYYELLVPADITDKEFWQRYCFRCDKDRIQKELEAYPQTQIKQMIADLDAKQTRGDQAKTTPRSSIALFLFSKKCWPRDRRPAYLALTATRPTWFMI